MAKTVMRNTDRRRRRTLILAGVSIISAASVLAPVADAGTLLQSPDVDDAVVATLESQGISQPKIIVHIDLTKPFDTVSSWTLVIAQDQSPQPPAEVEEQGPIAICLAKHLIPDCSEKLYQRVGGEDPRNATHARVLPVIRKHEEWCE